jgi:ribosomal protein S18 acetylase RimI-like enzyme
MQARPADEGEIDQLAGIWFEGWHESHARIVPPALTRLRTFENFRDRLRRALAQIRVVGPAGSPHGFCVLKGPEVYQLFVSAQARGTGVAATLIADAEAQLKARGIETAWLACAIGNDRAARFYEKSGWQRVGTMTNHAETAEGTFALDVWRYEKLLT